MQPLRLGSIKCEAGLPVSGYTASARLPPCYRQARWIVRGVALCGTCKRKLLA